MFEDHNLLPL